VAEPGRVSRGQKDTSPKSIFPTCENITPQLGGDSELMISPSGTIASLGLAFGLPIFCHFYPHRKHEERSMTTATIALPSAPIEFSPKELRGLLLGLGLATWMEFYTYDAVNLVLPDMAGSFGISQDEASWILTVYASAMFVGIPLSIWLANYVGHLRYLIASCMIFVVASLGCSLTSDFETFLFWRALQGFAGAGLAMWWRAGIYMLIPRAQRSGSLMRISVMLYLATATGLLFSGYVTDNVDWHLIFLPNMICVFAAIFLLRRFFPHIEPTAYGRQRSVDHLGIALLGLSLIALQIILSRGDIDDWFGAPRIQILAWASGISLVAFVCWQLSARNAAPILRLDLVRNRNALASIPLGIFAGIILSGSIYALPEYLRNVDPNKLSATQAGAVMCVYALTAAGVRPLATRAIARFGQRKVLVFAFSMLIASMLICARLITTGTPEIYYALPLALYALCLAPLLSAVGGGTVARMPQEKQLDSVSIYMTFRQFGTSLGVALITALLDNREELHSSRLFEHLNSSGTLVNGWLSNVTTTVIERGGETRIAAQMMANKILSVTSESQAATLAYADAFVFMAAVGVAALLVVPIMAPTTGVKK
jgi:MFS transporter, DHA2 family, multidrug resistance protein